MRSQAAKIMDPLSLWKKISVCFLRAPIPIDCYRIFLDFLKSHFFHYKSVQSPDSCALNPQSRASPGLVRRTRRHSHSWTHPDLGDSTGASTGDWEYLWTSHLLSTSDDHTQPMYIYICLYIYTCIYTCIYKYIHIYICIHTWNSRYGTCSVNIWLGNMMMNYK